MPKTTFTPDSHGTSYAIYCSRALHVILEVSQQTARYVAAVPRSRAKKWCSAYNEISVTEIPVLFLDYNNSTWLSYL